MKLAEIQDLIKFIAKAGVTEVEIEQKDFKITIKSEMPKRKQGFVEPMVHNINVPPTAEVPMQIPVVAPKVEAVVPAKAAEEVDENLNYIEVKSPMIGTFYRRPSPDKDPLKDVGDMIKEGDVVCVIEAMKLFNEIEAEIKGKIVKFLVEDNTPVEYDQPLFLVDPS
ncbi:MAG: acetyl-CoA carboxylase biotin carboxyl carrier protein [Flavobacteriales bacterium]|jgi:acetyl-CoA carboxylase biotin carboxyl carrier protein|nr:acetyl-CoA carboxylase biotin carboxyl carrier protein [Flavobacteriales bacterium]